MKKTLLLLLTALLLVGVIACDSGEEAADNDPVENAVQEEINEEVAEENAEETASDDVPAEVVEEEPDPGVSEQELATIPANAARSSELLGIAVDFGDMYMMEMDDVEDAAEEQAEGDMEDAAEEMEGEAEIVTGEISDMLIASDGTIQHVLLDINEGFAELIDTTVAVPWSMFAVSGMEEEGIFTSYHVTFTGTPENLTAAPVVEENFFDGDFWIDPVEYDFIDSVAGNNLYLATSISDLDLINPADEDLGEVEDLLINVNEGVVSYAVADFGGFLGMAETSTAVSWSALTFNEEEGSYVLDVTEEQLENAPEIDVSIFEDNIFTENWDAELAEFWSDLTS